MKAGSSQALASMNAALQGRCAAIQRLLTEAATDEIGTRYKIGSIIRTVKEAKDSYGERAVERLAEALGRDARRRSGSGCSPCRSRGGSAWPTTASCWAR